MMLIATHKDFTLDRTWKDTIIIDGGECKNLYNNATILHENEHPVRETALHGSYAEISRLLCAWEVYNMHLGEYVGFMQYKRMFPYTDNEISNILKEHDAILPKAIMQSPNVKQAFKSYHRAKEIDWAYERIPKICPEYKDAVKETLDGHLLRPHNVFIMKRKDFLDYGWFIKKILEAIDDELGYKTMKDIDVNYKLHGCLVERLSNIYYNKNFTKVFEIPMR